MRRILALVPIALGLGCPRATVPQLPARLQTELSVAARPWPGDGAAFLAEVVPLPAPAVLVVYDVSGAAGLHGSLEVMLRAGGYRRENWKLRVPDGTREAELSGSTIQTPDAIMTEGPRGRAVGAVPLAALAGAYERADERTRRDAVRTLRDIHARVLGARAAGASTETIGGVECRRTRIAAADLCMWDEVGVPLVLDTHAFHLRAIAIELDPGLGPHAFTIDEELPAAAEFDADEALRALAGGDPSEIAAWVHPGLRWPDPA